MNEPTKLTKLPNTLFIDDGANRGPLTMARVRFHPTEPVVFGQCVDRRLALWNTTDKSQKVKKGEFVIGKLVCPHDLGWVRGFAVHPRGEAIATGGSDRRLKLWAWKDGQPAETPEKDIAAHEGWVEAVAWSPDGERIATAGSDKLVKVWQAKSLEPIKSLAGHTRGLRDLAWSPDGSLLVSGGEDGLIQVFDGASLELKHSLVYGDANEQQGQNPAISGVHRLAISHDNRWLAASGDQKTLLFDLAAGVAVAADKTNLDCGLHPAALILAAGVDSPKVWRIDAEKLAPPKPEKDGKPGKPAALPARELATIKRGDNSLGLAFSPDGKVLALGKSDGTVELWELTS